MMKRAFVVTIAVVSLIILLHPGRHARYYDYIPASDALGEFVVGERQRSEPNLKTCPRNFYAELLTTGSETSNDAFISNNNFSQVQLGGEYLPRTCQPIFKTALIVPYRNRANHLRIFLNYMHAFLQHQKIHYRIFVVEQNDHLQFNRAKMLNVGANEAMNSGFPCLVLHDVDLLPLTAQSIYACSKKPRHMSSSIDTFRFNLPYLGLFGGAVAILSEQFRLVNGMSNVFDGWGGEDDDFFKRLEAYDLVPYRFAPEISRYTMLFHKKEKASRERWTKLENSLERHREDGLNSLPNNYKVVLEPLYTHVMV